MVSHLKEHLMSITDLVLFDDDIHLISSSRDKSFLCWDLRSEKRLSSHIQRMGGRQHHRDLSLYLSIYHSIYLPIY